MEPTEGTSSPTGGGDTITVRDLLQVLQEKDRLLSTLLERLTVVGVAQPRPAPTFQTRVAERWHRTQERVQQRNESTTAYFHSKVRLCYEVNLDFNATGEQVLTGLRSRELCTMLLGRTHDDDDDLLHDILEFERMERERRELFGSRNQSFMTPSFSERSLPATMKRGDR
ncbi:hypothetical protein MTO96_026753 [Rhipicephalus appendiculatus]